MITVTLCCQVAPVGGTARSRATAAVTGGGTATAATPETALDALRRVRILAAHRDTRLGALGLSGTTLPVDTLARQDELQYFAVERFAVKVLPQAAQVRSMAPP